MDLRKATKPRLVASAELGAMAPKFETGSELQKNVTQPKQQDITPTSIGTGAATPGPSEDYNEGDTVELHRVFLRDRGIEDPVILSVLDMLITGQEVLWQFELFDKIPVVFRVRPQWVDRYLIEELERLRPSNMARFTDLIGTINLAGSLDSYMGKKFSSTNIEELQQVAEFLGTLPFVIQNKLVSELAVFDRVVIVATSDWAVKNFTKPR